MFLKSNYVKMKKIIAYIFLIISTFQILDATKTQINDFAQNKLDYKNNKVIINNDSIKPRKIENPFDILEESQSSDSLYAFYTFAKGDTLEYVIHSVDSIIIDYDEPLLKLRFERILLVCDSVGINNHYYLTYLLKDFMGKESKGETKNVERKESKWVGKKVHLEIDSMGYRYNSFVIDTNEVAISPGGNFQPGLFFPFGYANKKNQETWLMNNKYTMPENGYPDAELKETSLYRMMGNVDTLGYSTIRMDYVRTGKGEVLHKSKNNTYITECVINSHGEMYFSPLIKKPIHFFVTIEQKLKFRTINGETKVGSQNTNSYFNLLYYNRDK